MTSPKKESLLSPSPPRGGHICENDGKYRIADLYDLHDSCRKAARELNVSRSTVRKYLNQVEAVRNGPNDEVLPEERRIAQPSRGLTGPVRQMVHR